MTRILPKRLFYVLFAFSCVSTFITIRESETIGIKLRVLFSKFGTNNSDVNGRNLVSGSLWENRVIQNGQQSIPKIIHQIWNDEIVPGEFVSNVQSLVRDNPEWRYVYWTQESGLKFIKDKYPFLYDKVNDTNHLLRSDILRCLVIYEYGGVYFDLDTVSVKSLDQFVDSHRCAVALEPPENYFNKRNREFLLTNGALLCVRRHPFYTHLVLHFTTVLTKTCQKAFQCTGPQLLTWMYEELNRSNNFAGELPEVQPSEVFQDVYDVKDQTKNVLATCNNAINWTPFKKKVCDNWVLRGKETRNLSAHALTYHTWFHIRNRKLDIKESNHVKNVVPHAKLYGKDF